MSLLEKGQPAEAERLLDQIPFRANHNKSKLGDLTISLYAFASTLLITTSLGLNDFANAERVASRIEWVGPSSSTERFLQGRNAVYCLALLKRPAYYLALT